MLSGQKWVLQLTHSSNSGCAPASSSALGSSLVPSAALEALASLQPSGNVFSSPVSFGHVCQCFHKAGGLWPKQVRCHLMIIFLEKRALSTRGPCLFRDPDPARGLHKGQSPSQEPSDLPISRRDNKVASRPLGVSEEAVPLDQVPYEAIAGVTGADHRDIKCVMRKGGFNAQFLFLHNSLDFHLRSHLSFYIVIKGGNAVSSLYIGTAPDKCLHFTE